MWINWVIITCLLHFNELWYFMDVIKLEGAVFPLSEDYVITNTFNPPTTHTYSSIHTPPTQETQTTHTLNLHINKIRIRVPWLVQFLKTSCYVCTLCCFFSPNVILIFCESVDTQIITVLRSKCGTLVAPAVSKSYIFNAISIYVQCNDYV